MGKRKIYYNTVTPFLKESLDLLMALPFFSAFRLVGGTALSLQLGHRKSLDIDLFTDTEYKTIDFEKLEILLKQNFKNVIGGGKVLPALGKSFFIGDSMDRNIKLDVYYTDNFIEEPILIDKIRMATLGEITAMKIDIIQRGGRKKDFWDLHELLSVFSIYKMLELHKKRHPYTHDKKLILDNLINFDKADHDFNPYCLKGKYWELIKEDIIEAHASLEKDLPG